MDTETRQNLGKLHNLRILVHIHTASKLTEEKHTKHWAGDKKLATITFEASRRAALGQKEESVKHSINFFHLLSSYYLPPTLVIIVENK